MKLSLLLPTKDRVDQLQTFLDSVVATADDLTQLEIILFVDQGDTPSENYLCPHENLNITKLIKPKMTMGEMMDTCLSEASGDIIMLVNDDIIIRSQGWDKAIIEAAEKFSDGIFLMYPNDLFKGEKLSAFPILSRKYVNLVGEPIPKLFRGAFIDTHLFDIFERLQRKGHNRYIYLPHVIFEHMHYRLGKSTFDKTYAHRHRFGDDKYFLALNQYRDQLSSFLSRVIENNAAHEKNCPTKPSELTLKINGGLTLYLKHTLFDKTLPLKKRLHQGGYFMARYGYNLLTGFKNK